MKKKVLKSIICFLLSVIMIAECNVGTMTVHAAEIVKKADSEITEEEANTETSDETEAESEEAITASSYLYPFEEAVTALEELAVTRDIQAVVYLADTVTLRMLPEEGSEPVKNLVSGDVVSIIGAGQDTEYNIWYQISYKDEIEEVTGYIRKDNVACVDQEFVKWQESYVRSIGMFGGTRGGYSYSDIEMFPASYQNALYALKQQHPNWIFVKMNTNINWKTLVNSQIGNRSWIWAPTAKDNWKDGMTGTTNWAYASEGIVKYYLDPRNWLGEKDVFQYELLGYYSEYHTVEAVESILASSFMANKTIENGKTYAQTFVELGKATGVSPFLMASRVRQEQGTNGNSALISGTYEGYEGYYNYYNIGASGNSDKETIVNGLKKAKEKGWDSRYKALKGGAEFLGVEYIKAGQDTLYLQKFDVDDRVYGVFSHQYMQNIQAPSTESRNVYKAYSNKGLLNQAFIFRIPVYNNMPSKAVVLPGEEDKITLSSSVIDNLQVDSEITLRPYVNGKEAEGLNWSFTSSNEEVATVDNEGVVKALKAGETTITCKSVDDPDNPNVGTCKITVIPADIDITKLEIPVLEEITYNPNVTLKDIVLPTGYTWVNPDMVPVAAQSAYGVTYNPDEEKYNPITFDITLKVNKKVLTSADYTIPTGLEGGATRELNSVMLPNGFIWNNPLEKLADTIGTKEYLASYNPDSANYETVKDIKIPIKIVCEKHEFGEWEIKEATCEADGTKIRKCSICGSKEELVIEKTGHYYESQVTEEATEEKEGIRTYTCKNCGDTYIETIPKLPSTHVHEYEESIVKKASCTEDGEKAFECSCGDKYTEIIAATGHKVDNGRCQQCGYTENIETPKDDNTDSNEPSGDGTAGSGTTDNSKPSEGGNTGSSSTDNSKPSEGGSTGSSSTDNSKPSGGGNTGSSSTDNSKPSGGGNTGSSSTDNSKPGDTGNSNNTGSDNSSSGDNNSTNNGSAGNNSTSGTTNNGSANNNGNTNNGNGNNGSNANGGGTNSDTANNNGATNNNTNNDVDNNNNNNSNTNTNNSNTNSSITNNNVTNSGSANNSSTTNGNTNSSVNNTTNNTNNNAASNGNTQNNSTTSNSADSVNNSTTTNTDANNNSSTNNNVTEETNTQKPDASTVTQVQTEEPNRTNQVEEELMSDLMESAREEESVNGEKQTVSIQLNKNTEISQKIVEMAKDHGVDLEVNLSNKLKWTIKADSLSGGMPSAVNMNAEIVQDVIKKEIIDIVASENEYMELSLSHDGEFGFEATLTIPVDETYAGQTASLFYFNEKTKELEFQMATPVDDEYNIQFEFNHASDYVIVFAENSLAQVMANVETSADSSLDESTKDITSTDNEKKDSNNLLVICLIIMILAGGLAAAGYFIYFNKKEISDGQDFEEWLKEDKESKTEKETEKKTVPKKEKETEKKTVSKKEKEAEKKAVPKKEKETEKKAVPKKEKEAEKKAVPKKEKEAEKKAVPKREKEADKYLDDDVDDYKEKEIVTSNLTDTGRILIRDEVSPEEYLDDDVDDYIEKM